MDSRGIQNSKFNRRISALSEKNFQSQQENRSFEVIQEENHR